MKLSDVMKPLKPISMPFVVVVEVQAVRGATGLVVGATEYVQVKVQVALVFPVPVLTLTLCV